MYTHAGDDSTMNVIGSSLLQWIRTNERHSIESSCVADRYLSCNCHNFYGTVSLSVLTRSQVLLVTNCVGIFFIISSHQQRGRTLYGFSDQTAGCQVPRPPSNAKASTKIFLVVVLDEEDVLQEGLCCWHSEAWIPNLQRLQPAQI